MPCSIIDWRRGIESEGIRLYYRLEEMDRNGGMLSLLQAGGEGSRGREVNYITGWRRVIEKEENWLYYRLTKRVRKGWKLALKQAGSEGQKGREIGFLAGWMRGIEREGNWLYYMLGERDIKRKENLRSKGWREERDTKRGKLALHIRG